MSSRASVFLAVVLTALTSLVSTSAASAHPSYQPRFNPVIFVHGGAGSGAQFESQKMRFTSNGYPVPCCSRRTSA